MTLETNTETIISDSTIADSINDVINDHIASSAKESSHANEVAEELLTKVAGDMNESPDNANHTPGNEENSGGNNDTPENPIPNEFSGMKDSSGQFFDASIHYIDEQTGKPKVTPTGKFRRRRGGSSNTTAKSPVNPSVNNIAACQAAGRATGDSIIMLGMMLFGEAGKPVATAGYNEREELQKAWTDYYIATGAITLPPWLMVSIATAGYAIPRLSNPEVQMRLYVMYQGIRNVMGGNKNGTSSNSGDDRKR